jgi:hypothetical protein
VGEHDEQCDDGGDDACPICEGRMSADFVMKIQRAAAQPGRAMTAEEMTAWLRGLDAGSAEPC